MVVQGVDGRAENAGGFTQTLRAEAVLTEPQKLPYTRRSARQAHPSTTSGWVFQGSQKFFLDVLVKCILS